ncbi:MAG: hypothetical protein ABF297_00235 [Thiogranum sp.]
MNDVTRFAYAQARLQSRHGQRADEQVWRRLHSTGDLADYLQMARQTVLRPWVIGIDSSRSSHDIEFTLRRQFYRYVDDVSHWLPADWRAAFQALHLLPLLPTLQHLLSGAGVSAWMLDDPELQDFASENARLRMEAMQASEYGYLLPAWERGEALYDTWYDHWQRLWPGPVRLNAAMKQLGRLMLQQVRSQGSGTGSTRQRRDELAIRLTGIFRKFSFQPVAAFAHLALVALDLEQLRGDLLSRKLFVEGVA